MKLFVIISLGFLMASCSEDGNYNRSYVISKTDLDLDDQEVAED